MFKVLCRERGGDVLREVRLMPRDLAHIMDLYAKLGQVVNFLSKTNPVGIFIDQRNTFFEVDDVGIIAVLPFGGDIMGCHVHITFWDRILRGREGLCRTLAEWVTELRREPLFTAIPDQDRVVLAFAKRVGFTVWREADNVVTLRFDRAYH